jgi:hypothetical protein
MLQETSDFLPGFFHVNGTQFILLLVKESNNIVASLCVNKHNNASSQHTMSFCLFQANSLFTRVSAQAVLLSASRHRGPVSVKGITS